MGFKTTAELMTTDVVTVRPRQQLKRAVTELQMGRIRHLPVVDERGFLVGLVTQRDILSAELDLERPIAELMQSDIKTVDPQTPAYEAAYLLLRHDIGCVPVTDGDGRLVGIVTETDFVRVAYSALGGAVSVDQLEAEEREADRV